MKIGGKTISTFRPDAIKVGDNLKVTYNENGNFLRAAMIEVVPIATLAADSKQTVLPAYPSTKVSDVMLGMVLKEASRANPQGTKEQIKARAMMLLEIERELKNELQ